MFIELTLKSEQEEYVREVRKGRRKGGEEGERDRGREGWERKREGRRKEEMEGKSK